MELTAEPTSDTPTAAPASTSPPRRPGVWSGIGVVVLYFVLQFAFAIVVAIAMGILFAVRAGIEAGAQHRAVDGRAIVQSMLGSPDAKVILTVVAVAAAAAVTAWVVRRTWRPLWSLADPPGFGFTRASHGSDYLIAVVVGVILLFLGGLLRNLLAHGHPQPQDIRVMFSHATLASRVLLVLIAVCVAPLVEELIFRGVLLSGLMRRMAAGWAVLISAVIFGCAHLPDFKFAWYAVPTLVIMGLVLGWLRLRSRSLWPSITLHATNNFVAMVALFVATYR